MAGVSLSGAWGGAHVGMLAGVDGVVKLYFLNALDCWGCEGWGSKHARTQRMNLRNSAREAQTIRREKQIPHYVRDDRVRCGWTTGDAGLVNAAKT